MGLHIINFLECIQSCVMCMNIEIASIIFEICIVPEPATTSGTGLLLDRDTGHVNLAAAKPCRFMPKLRDSDPVEVFIFRV